VAESQVQIGAFAALRGRENLGGALSKSTTSPRRDMRLIAQRRQKRPACRSGPNSLGRPGGPSMERFQVHTIDGSARDRLECPAGIGLPSSTFSTIRSCWMRNMHQTAKASRLRDAARIIAVDDGLGVTDAGLQHSGTLHDGDGSLHSRPNAQVIESCETFYFRHLSHKHSLLAIVAPAQQSEPRLPAILLVRKPTRTIIRGNRVRAYDGRWPNSWFRHGGLVDAIRRISIRGLAGLFSGLISLSGRSCSRGDKGCRWGTGPGAGCPRAAA
jgi:hypothetical protein